MVLKARRSTAITTTADVRETFALTRSRRARYRFSDQSDIQIDCSEIALLVTLRDAYD